MFWVLGQSGNLDLGLGDNAPKEYPAGSEHRRGIQYIVYSIPDFVDFPSMYYLLVRVVLAAFSINPVHPPFCS